MTGRTPHVARLEQLGRARARRPQEPGIGAIVERIGARAREQQRKLGQLAELWTGQVPAELVDRTTIQAMRGGVLHVTADSSAVAFELDRALRGGLEARLRESYRGTLSRVKVTVAPPA